MEILELINVWMTALLPFVTEMLKRFFPTLDSRIGAIVTIVVFLFFFYLGGTEAVEMFVSVVTALAGYGLLLKPVVIEPLFGERVKRKKV